MKIDKATINLIRALDKVNNLRATRRDRVALNLPDDERLTNLLNLHIDVYHFILHTNANLFQN